MPPPDELVARFAMVRSYTGNLIARLSAEDAMIQSMPDASPAKWHAAHTNWFFEAVVLPALPGYAQFDQRFGYLFNSYYESLGPRHPRPSRGLIARPSLDEVMEWRAHVDTAMAKVLERPELRDAIVLGISHEQQHQELILTDIKHAFFCNPILPAYMTEAAAVHAPVPLDFISVAGGTALIGHDGDGFAFDNELPRHEVALRPFEIGSRPVNNAEYREFVEDGGYRRPEFWLSDGWSLLQRQGWEAPLYWLKGYPHGDKLDDFAFTLAGVKALDPNAPVEHVSFYEAAAFAAWAGARLPTEFEWEAASRLFHHGEVWEWTRSSYDPYPCYKPFDGIAAEYNGKFMIGQMVLRGGSTVTPPGHTRQTYRNFFPPQVRWQFSGIRLAMNVD